MTGKRLYDSVRWRKARAIYLAEHPLCALCAKMGKDTAATIVDHIERHEGNYEKFWSQDNWQALCAACHSGTKRIEDEQGYSQAAGIDGYPLDPKHPWAKEQL